MTASRDPDRLIQAFLDEGEEQLDDRIYDTVRASIEQQRQRVVIGPWSTPSMNKFVTFGLAAAAVVVAVLIGAQLFGSPGGGLGSPPSPSATAEPTPSPSAETGAPPLTQTFTSAQHGYSVSIPEAWTAEAATEPWTGPFPLSFTVPQVDFLYDPVLEHDLFLAIASQPTGDSTPEDWVAEQMASEEGCGTATLPVTVDGASGLIGGESCSVAVVTTAGRGYWIQLYTGSGAPVTTYDESWFEEVLATVQLSPEDAVDAGPSPSP